MGGGKGGMVEIHAEVRVSGVAWPVPAKSANKIEKN